MANALTWVGHATVTIDLDGTRLLTDPALREYLGPLRRHGPMVHSPWYAGVDAVLISHLHRDHLDLPSLRLLGSGTRLIVPRGAGALLHRSGFEDVVELSVGQTTRIGPLEVSATPAKHSGFRPPAGPTAEALGYLVRGTRCVYFAGDTDLFPEMDGLGQNPDVALLPVGGWGPNLGPGHLDPRRAAQALCLLQPRSAVPIHWGTLWPRGLAWLRNERFYQPGREFAVYAASLAPAVDVHVISPGDSLPLPED